MTRIVTVNVSTTSTGERTGMVSSAVTTPVLVSILIPEAETLAIAIAAIVPLVFLEVAVIVSMLNR